MVNELLAALVRPVDAAVRVYRPTVLNTRPLNVATPATALTVAVGPAGVDVNDTDAVDVADGLLNASCTCTVTAGMAAPAVPFAGCVANCNFAAAPATIPKELLMAPFRAPEVACKV
jgi:hypothetical protein